MRVSKAEFRAALCESRFLDHSRRFHRLRVPRNDKVYAGLGMERGVELIEQLGVVGQRSLEDFGLLFGNRPVLGFDGFG